MKRNESKTKRPEGKSLRFLRKGTRFILSTTLVSEISKPRPLTPVPYSSPSLRGIFNLRGAIVPLYDLDRKVEEEDEGLPKNGNTSRFLILSDSNRTLALLADGIEGFFPPEEAGPADREISRRELEELTLMDAQGDSVRFSFNPAGLGTGDAAPLAERRTMSVFIFQVNGREYAVELEVVSELIQVSEVEEVPGAPVCVAGMTLHRDLPIHLLDLSSLLNHGEKESLPIPRPQRGGYALNLVLDGTTVGLMVDGIGDIVAVEESSLRTEATVLSAFGEEIRGVIDRDDGKRPVLLLNHRYLSSRIDHAFLRRSGDRKRGQMDARAAVEVSHGPLRRMLLFSLLDVFYALPVEEIKEISTLHDLTPLPEGGPSLLGVANFRGVVHSVIDLKKALGLHSLPEQVRILNEKVRKMVWDKRQSQLRLNEKSARILQGMGKKRVMGARACRQLADDLSRPGRDVAVALDEFEGLLSAEAERMSRAPKILILNGPLPRALTVDTVQAVIEVEDLGRGSFFWDEAGEEVRIPDLKTFVPEGGPVRTDG